jgi:hypothetical protein
MIAEACCFGCFQCTPQKRRERGRNPPRNGTTTSRLCGSPRALPLSLSQARRKTELPTTVSRVGH